MKSAMPLMVLTITFLALSCSRISTINLMSLNEPVDISSCAQQKQITPSATSGTYYFNLDENDSTPLQAVDCDFDNDPDEWTKLTLNNINDLEQFGDTNNIQGSFYTDPTSGIGWGNLPNTGGSNPIPSVLDCFVLDKIKNISKIKITFTWSGTDQIGYLFMGNKIDPLRYSDWGSYWNIHAEEGAFTTINAWPFTPLRNRVAEHNPNPTSDITHFESSNSQGVEVSVTKDYSSHGNLEICMGGEAGYTYNRRFIKDFAFK